jgi:hypothetical protein
MSTETLIPVRFPQLKYPTKQRPVTSSPKTVRFFRCSPSSATLQIRFEKHIATVDLSAAQLRELAAAMLAEAAEIDGGAS